MDETWLPIKVEAGEFNFAEAYQVSYLKLWQPLKNPGVPAPDIDKSAEQRIVQ